jgi:dihydroorotase
MKAIIITNGRLIDPGQGIDEIGQILIAGGKIQQLGKKISTESGCEVIDAAGLVVCPGFIDLHCHLRQPGFEYKETVASGTAAAAKGGFTTICCMPNTSPPQDNAAVIGHINQLSATCAARVLPIGCITRGRRGEELADLAEQFAAGAIGFSDDGSYVSSARVMRRAMEYSRPLGRPVIEHCEEPALAEGGQMNEGIIATRLGLAGIPGAAEEIAVARDIVLAELTGAWLHIAHVSTAGSVELVRQAKRRGLRVTAEATPHHLTMTEERVLGFNTLAKVNPPLRTQKDVDALINGLNEGTLDIIATDHAPHADNDKLCEFAAAASGISGFETAFGSLMGLVHSGKMDLNTVLAKLTSEPAKILPPGNRLGTLVKGSSADVVVLDPDTGWTVDANRFVSKGKNTPLNGEKLKGKVMLTVYEGKITYRDEGF